MHVNISQHTVEGQPGYLIQMNFDADFNHDLKLLPSRARRFVKERRGWWVSELYWMGLSDFLMAHYGIDWTPPAVGNFETSRVMGTKESERVEYEPDTGGWIGGRG